MRFSLLIVINFSLICSVYLIPSPDPEPRIPTITTTTGNCTAHNEIRNNDVKKKPLVVRDVGDALFLTPLLRQGRIKEAKELARVKDLPGIYLPSYSGFLTVNEKFNSSLFFWFFPAAFDAENAPVLLWLQGGPGLSTFYGIFLEHGPFRLDEYRNLKLREYPWTLTHNVLYVDSPVGTGFSSTGSPDGYSKLVSDASENLYQGLVQFFELMPEFKSNPFFLTGQSYAGKFVPSLSMKIHEENQKIAEKNRINLKGFAVGSGFFDPFIQSDYGDYFYNLGIIDESQKLIYDIEHQRLGEAIDQDDWKKAYEVLQNIIIGWPGPDLTHFKNTTGLDYKSNFVLSRVPKDLEYGIKFLEKDFIRKALHVGPQPLGNSSYVFEAMHLDISQSVKPLVESILDLGYRVLIYSTQLDIIVPHTGLRKLVNSLKWSGSEQFRQSGQKIWKVGQEVAGYIKATDNLKYLFMRSAGHSAPADQPEWCFRMITDFTRGVLRS